MMWWIAKKKETKEAIEIAFSYQCDDADGIAVFDKKTKKLTLVKEPDNCKDILTERVFQFVWALMKRGELTTKGRWVITG